MSNNTTTTHLTDIISEFDYYCIKNNQKLNEQGKLYYFDVNSDDDKLMFEVDTTLNSSVSENHISKNADKRKVLEWNLEILKLENDNIKKDYEHSIKIVDI